MPTRYHYPTGSDGFGMSAAVELRQPKKAALPTSWWVGKKTRAEFSEAYQRERPRIERRVALPKAEGDA